MRVALLLLLAGCASLDAQGCRDADWYRLGFRDAMYGLQRQDFTYESQCAPHARSAVARLQQVRSKLAPVGGRYPIDHPAEEASQRMQQRQWQFPDEAQENAGERQVWYPCALP